MKVRKVRKVRIEDRDVYIVWGSNSQTINICTAANQKGSYQQKIRLHDKAAFVTVEDLLGKNIEALVKWLVTERRGMVEIALGNKSIEITGDSGGRTEVEILEELPAPVDGNVKIDKEWIEEAKQVTEFCINRLVEEFVEFPYLHRVEHSIHARLFELLRSQPPLDRFYPLCGGVLSQPVHKEWPEAKPRPEKGNRRGNFDIAVLYPSQLRSCKPEDFSTGRLAPAIAIEMGLNYGAGHLDGDWKKMINSGTKYGYLIHLAREENVKPEVKQVINEIRQTQHIQVAFAEVSRTQRFIKMLSDTEIHEVK